MYYVDVMKKDLKYYTGLLPKRINVMVERDENGLSASIKEIPFCYTQGSNATELTEMLNDAIFTHYEIPESLRKKVGYYVPVPAKHLKIEEMFRKLVAMDNAKEVTETFNLASHNLVS